MLGGVHERLWQGCGSWTGPGSRMHVLSESHLQRNDISGCFEAPGGGAAQLGDHGAALRVLALVLGDMRAAEAYCARWARGEGHLALLDALLRPGDGRPPLYAEACHLLAAQGAAGARLRAPSRRAGWKLRSSQPRS